MPQDTDVSTVTPSNNPLLSQLRDVTGAIRGAGTDLLDLYSQFLGARSVRDLARRQQTPPEDIPSQGGQLFANATKSPAVLIMGGIAVLATGVLLFKAIK